MVTGAAPHFKIPALEGGTGSFVELISQGPLLLAFFKVTCPTCQLTFPFLERLHRAVSDATPRIAAISQDDESATRKFHQQFGITIPTLLDPAAQRYPASNAYRISEVPSLFLVEGDGQITWSVAGFYKHEMEQLGHRFHFELFNATDRAPIMRPG